MKPSTSLLDDAKALRKQLVALDSDVKLTIFPPPPDGDKPDGGANAVGLVVVINSPTIEEAFDHAEELRKAYGCNCVSSGETEITCTCPD